MSLLQTVIDKKIAFGCVDRQDALYDIAKTMDSCEFGPYKTAKMFGVLRDNSAADFAIEFYSAYNAEIYPKY